MKILFPCDVDPNPFVRTLADEMRARGHRVDQGVDFFWNSAERYDIVHFQWPNAVFRWNDADVTDARIAEALGRIAFFRSGGARILITRHNERPHWANPQLTKLYEAIEGACDTVVHLGEASVRSAKALPHMAKLKHVVVPHHIYPGIDRAVSREAARARLGIADGARVMLAFGAFRNDEERLLALQAAADCRVRLLAPRLFQFPVRRKGQGVDWTEFRRRLRFLRFGVFSANRMVSDEDLPNYFAAADAVFLQRIGTLNSGNLPMAYSFGKVVIGPDCGNIGEILRTTGNPTFDPKDAKSVATAVRRGFELAAAGKGAENRARAEADWRVGKVVSWLLAAYDPAKEGRSA